MTALQGLRKRRIPECAPAITGKTTTIQSIGSVRPDLEIDHSLGKGMRGKRASRRASTIWCSKANRNPGANCAEMLTQTQLEEASRTQAVLHNGLQEHRYPQRAAPPTEMGAETCELGGRTSGRHDNLLAQDARSLPLCRLPSQVSEDLWVGNPVVGAWAP